MHKLSIDDRRSELAILHGHDGGCRAGRANAIAYGIDAREAGLEARIDGDEFLAGGEAEKRGERGLLLADGFDDLVRGQQKL